MASLNTVFGKVEYSFGVTKYEDLHRPVEFEATVRVPKILSPLLSRIVDLMESGYIRVRSWRVRHNKKTSTLVVKAVTMRNYWDTAYVRSSIETALLDFLISPDSDYRPYGKIIIEGAEIYFTYHYEMFSPCYLAIKAIIVTDRQLHEDKFTKHTPQLYTYYREFPIDLDVKTAIDIVKKEIAKYLSGKIHENVLPATLT